MPRRKTGKGPPRGKKFKGKLESQPLQNSSRQEATRNSFEGNPKLLTVAQGICKKIGAGKGWGRTSEPQAGRGGPIGKPTKW